MQVSVEKVSSVECRLTIIVPALQVEEAYANQINRFAKNANVKGFRPGKVPLSFIQKRFGDDARREALSEVMQKALYEAITTEKLKPISTPQVEPKTITPDHPLEFTASFEVLPEIGKIEFSLDKIEKLNVEISPEDVEHVVQQLKKQYTKWTLVKRPAQKEDRVVIDYYSIFEGKAETENKMQNFPLELGSNVMLPGFEEGLLGAKEGEERKLNLSFPSDFKLADRAGKPVEFVVQVNQVFEAELPTMDEKFIKKLGVKSGQIEDLKQQINQTLNLERDRLLSEKLKEQVFSKLIEQNLIEVPHSLVSNEVKRIHDEIYPSHQAHNHDHSDDEMGAFQDIAKKRILLGLLIAEYAKQADLKADKDRVQKRIQVIASAYENPHEVLTYLSQDDQRKNIEAQVIEDEVLDKLMADIPVNEKSMSYAELKGIAI